MLPPISHASIPRRSALFAAVSLAALLAACSPTPTPTPTPTAAFASEEDAFAAAEKTYQEFTARLNRVDVADPATFEPLYELSSGEFERADREAYSAMHAKNYTVSGSTKIVSFRATHSSAALDRVEADVCLDVRGVTVVDSVGVSQVDSNRPDVYGLQVTFVADGGSFTIDSAAVDEEMPCAT